jgi:GntR family transcriptional regulator, transcriptional repressor for pyruvate dehydrogenase complex
LSTSAPDNSPRARTFAPLRAPNASELIVRRIGEAIGSGVLAPSEQLPSELELATMLVVAPMTLRQAIAILREAGMVETRRGKNGGTFVSANVVDALAARKRRVDRQSVRDLSDWRRAVSGEAAALAAERIDPDQLGQLDQFADAAQQQADEGFPAFRLADSRFHLAIAESSGSSRLIAAETAIQSELGEILAAIPAPVRSLRASTGGHDPILRAIHDSDPAVAREATIRHVEATYDWVVGLSAAPRARQSPRSLPTRRAR